MPITTQRKIAIDLTTFECDGNLSLNEIVAVIERYFQEAVAPRTNKIIWDMRTASIDLLTVDHVNRIANLVNIYRAEAKGTKIAVVVSKNINFDYAKKFRAKAQESLINLILFRKIDEATEWLEKESE